MSISKPHKPPVVRIAPSPTGDPHVGTAYIALFNYAFAKQHGGKFLLRIEDTDRVRSTRESEQKILESLRWLGLSWDEGPDVGGPNGPYRQSERLPIYQQHVAMLVASKKAYKCTCTSERLDVIRKEQLARKETPGYDGYCKTRHAEVDAEIAAGKTHVVRLDVPRGEGDPKADAHRAPQPVKVRFEDALRGVVEIDTREIDDQVLMKSDGFPTYHLANIVDDHLMGVTHVMRGEEWISSTPKHVLLYAAFGWEAPLFAHLPLLRNNDKSKVSKRKNPVSLTYFQECGYFPDALINFLGTMAFTFEDGREIFTLPDFVENFRLERVVLGGPVFDLKRLLWFNGRYMREKRTDADVASSLQQLLFSQEYLEKIVHICKERFEKAEDLIEYAPYFFTGTVQPPVEELLVKGKTKKESMELWLELAEKVDVTPLWTLDTVNALLHAFMESKSVTAKEMMMPLRWLMTGKKATPPMPETIAVLGRERTRTRIRAAVEMLKKLPDAPAPAPAA
jgi:glutamyl-tRNA synthetase